MSVLFGQIMNARTIICTLVAIIAIGCTLRDEVIISHPKRIVDYREYIDSVIYENYEYFGDVLILDSLEEAHPF